MNIYIPSERSVRPGPRTLPDSSSAFVNFCWYEDANEARNTLQGRTVAGTGPLRINACRSYDLYRVRVDVGSVKRPKRKRRWLHRWFNNSVSCDERYANPT